MDNLETKTTVQICQLIKSEIAKDIVNYIEEKLMSE